MKPKSTSKNQLRAKVFSILFCLTIITSLVLYTTNNFIQRSEDLSPNELVQKNKRDYVGIWGLDQINILEVTVDYQGKRPELPFENLSSFDDKKHNADFYSCTLRNLTELPIEISSAEFFSEKGERKINKGPKYLKKKWSSTIIEPGQTIHRRNLWVWGEGDDNRLIITYQAQILNSPNTPSIKKLAERIAQNKGNPLTFPFQVTLQFLR
tara:strand:+ start:5407 stop:6036 length:630 start_codon:yes stop_codon:yes gene_type:complete